MKWIGWPLNFTLHLYFSLLTLVRIDEIADNVRVYVCPQVCNCLKEIYYKDVFNGHTSESCFKHSWLPLENAVLRLEPPVAYSQCPPNIVEVSGSHPIGIVLSRLPKDTLHRSQGCPDISGFVSRLGQTFGS